MKKMLIAMTCLPLFACGPVENDEEPLTKEEAIEMYESKTDEGRDFCDEFGWYGDGACDTFCPTNDPDCDSNAGHDPCGPSSVCGDTCTLCAPGDSDCVESSVVKHCQADGSCDAPQPTCEAEYDPCGDGAACGTSCTQCDPADSDCVETAVLKYCQTDGSCDALEPTCEAEYEPCADAICGESCTQCDPADSDCVETAEVKSCHPDGSCSGLTPTCD